MKKDIKSVWILENGDTIIGCNYNWKTGIDQVKYYSAYEFFVQTTDGIMEYTKSEMVEIYSLTEDNFDNINHNHF